MTFETVGIFLPNTKSNWQHFLGLNNQISFQAPEGSREPVPKPIDNTEIGHIPISKGSHITTPTKAQETPTPRISSRLHKTTQVTIESIEQGTGIAYETIDNQIYDEYFELLSELEDTMAFKSKTYPYMIYMHEALRQKERDEFLKPVEKEVHDYESHFRWRIVKRSEFPTSNKVVPCTWYTKRK